MSLKTWKAEFYPCDAASTEAQGAPAAHSLRKWSGVTTKNLKRHRVTLRRGGYLGGGAEGNLYLDNETCALCHANPHTCEGCVLATVRNGVPCCNVAPGEDLSPWQRASQGDSRQLLKFLRLAVKLEAAERKR